MPLARKLGLLLITDPDVAPRDLPERVGRAIAGGVRASNTAEVQFPARVPPALGKTVGRIGYDKIHRVIGDVLQFFEAIPKNNCIEIGLIV